MKVKELEVLLTNHLIESTGIKEKLHNVDRKINWVLTLLSGAFLVLLTAFLRR